MFPNRVVALCLIAGPLLTGSVHTIDHVVSEVDEGTSHHSISYWRTAERNGTRYYVVAFENTALNRATLEELIHSDADILLVPPHAFQVFTTLRTLLALPYEIRWLREVRGIHKYSSDLLLNASESLTVTVHSAVSVPFASVFQSRGIPKTSYSIHDDPFFYDPHKTHITLHHDATDLIAVLAARFEVSYVGRAAVFEPLNNIATSIVQQGGIVGGERRAPPIWAHGLTGEGERIHIGDTGVDLNSCFFHDPEEDVAYYPETNEKHRKVISYVKYKLERLEDATDKLLHGTHVAGSLAGRSLGDNSAFDGLAKDAKLVFSDLASERHVHLPVDLTQFFLPGYLSRCAVSSNSWGLKTRTTTYEGADVAVDEFLYYHQDYMAVFSAGNVREKGVVTPAHSKNSLSVGGHSNSEDATELENIGGYSAMGPTFDGRVKPDVMAPGGATRSAHGDSDQLQCDLLTLSGTSMAAPLVSASAALIHEYFTKGYYPSGKKHGDPPLHPSSSLLKAMVIHSTLPLHGKDAEGAESLPHNSQGYGRVELQQGLYFRDVHTPQAKNFLHIVNNASILQSEVRHLCFTAKAGREIRITLVWMDPPAAPFSTHTLINDIDITLQDHSGVIHYANSRPSYERNSNVEVIRLTPTHAGTYRLFITGHLIREHAPYADGLPYSVVLSGEEISVMDQGCEELPCPALVGNDESLPCSGHGACDETTGLCHCDDGFFHSRCELCDPLHLCNAKGSCIPIEDHYECICDGHNTGPSCASCEEGWYGPNCEGDCLCQNEGICENGVCICINNESGHWGGPHCDQCTHGFTGEKCLERAFWCENNEVVEITDLTGHIQVNGGPVYDNGMTCRWLILFPDGVDMGLDLRFEYIDVEERHDWVRAYDGVDEFSPHIFTLPGKQDPFSWYIKRDAGQRGVLIKFIADHIKNGRGFELNFDIVVGCLPASLREEWVTSRRLVPPHYVSEATLARHAEEGMV